MTDMTQPWVAPVSERLYFLVNKRINEGGVLLDDTHIADAFLFLNAVMLPDTPAPSIVPFESGLQLEWHRNGYDVEIMFCDVEGIGNELSVADALNPDGIEYPDARAAFIRLNLAVELQ